MIGVTTKVDLSRLQLSKVVNFNSNPRQRSAASRILNRQGRNIIQTAQEIARAELKNDRPEARRRQGGRHYIDSFVILPGDVATIDRTVIRWTNRHPAANIIEFGSGPHQIPTAPGYMKFPYRPGATRGGPRRAPGNWPVDFRQGGKTWSKKGTVNHPGTPAFAIMRRAAALYRQRVRRL